MMAARRLARALLLAVVFSGCASLPPAYKEGMRLIDAGMTEQGIAQLEQASREAPGNPEVRGRLARERELASARFNEAGSAARADGRARDAELAYRRALHVNSNDERAKLGLEMLAMDRRHAESIKNAEALMAKRDLAGAQALLRAVLTEDPKNRTARAQLNSIASALAWNASNRRELKAAAGKRISLQFRDATLKQVFDMIARNAGINFAFDKDVRSDARITISIRNATVDDVIQLILATNQLERKVLNDSTLLIYPNTPAKQREHQELMVRSFYIANADVSKVLGMLKAVMKTRDAFVDEKLNLLVIRDTPEAIRLAEKLIAAQDRADPEVTLDVEVLEVSSTYLRNIGPQFPEKINFQSPATVSTGTAAVTVASQRVSDPLVAFVATPAVILNLKQQDGVTNLLANPRIRVKNREKAKIHIGDKVPVVTTTAAVNVGTSSSVNYLDVGLKLEVEPSIRIESDVEIRVGLEVSNIVKEVPVPNGGLAYQIGTRNASTVLRLADGETQVLAGLIQDDDRNTTSKVPGLGDLPVLGRLFGSKNASRTKNEIVLLITPRIARNIAPPEPEIAELFFGTDSSVGASPLLASPGGMAMAATAPGKPEAAPAGKPIARGPISVTMAVPPRAQLGSELTVEVMVPADPRVASGSVALRYDPAVLAVGAGAGEPKVPGELTVDVHNGSEPTEVRVSFRVIAKSPGNTQVSVMGASLLDRSGRPLSVVPASVAAIELYQ